MPKRESQMRIIGTLVLSTVFLAGAPVVAGLASSSDRDLPVANETIVYKSAPDGTWPFEPKRRSLDGLWV
jgi:hypothetical protein